RFIYSCLTSVPTGSTETTCSSTNAEFSFAPSGSGLSRTTTTDTRTINGQTTYVLNGSSSPNGYHVNLVYPLAGGRTSTLCTTNPPQPAPAAGLTAWAPPTPSTDWNIVGNDQPYIEIWTYNRTDCAIGGTAPVGTVSKVRFYFRGVEWTKGNDL